MEIISATIKDAELLASIVSNSNRDVAERYKLDRNNASKHPSLCTAEWIINDLKRGCEYFLYREDGLTKGCVAYEQPDNVTAYLNRLSVLSEYRHGGIGRKLVEHVLSYSKKNGVKVVSIGIIAEHHLLQDWYRDLGFETGERKVFDHLPFDVLYMQYEL